jgi:polysaccharide export outer membrane protein
MLISPLYAQRKPGSPQPDRSVTQTAPAGREIADERAGVDSNYKISPDDLLEIKIEDAPELSRSYQVDASGQIEMPIIGSVVAKQKTANELARLITAGLRQQDYLNNPNVVVTVRQVSAKTYFIQGAVHKSGVFQIEGRPSLLTIIGLAGGLADNHGSTVFILRPNKTQKQSQDANLQAKEENQDSGADSANAADYDLIRVNLSALYKGQFEQNLKLEPGDIINIPRADVFFVAGEVHAPGSFPLKEGTTLRQAISLAQGLTFKARNGDGTIFREDSESGRRQEIKIDIGAVMNGKKEDIPILANDVIIIPNSRTKSVGGAILMALGINSARLPMRY